MTTVDTPPCTCLLGDEHVVRDGHGEPIRRVTFVILRDPYCKADPRHREEGTLGYEPEYPAAG